MIQANDLSPTLRRETVLTPLKLPESEQEQSIELDYVLPDYYPDFFRLLACTAEASVTAEPPAVEHMQLNMQRVLQRAVADALRGDGSFRRAGEQTEKIRIIIRQHIIELHTLFLCQLRQMRAMKLKRTSS